MYVVCSVAAVVCGCLKVLLPTNTVTKCLSMSLSEILGHFITVVQQAHGNTRGNTSRYNEGNEEILSEGGK